MRFAFCLRVIGVLMLLSLSFFGRADAKEGTVKALSAWHGVGMTFLVEERQAFVIGALGGIMFIEGGANDFDAANLMCPATVEINITSGARKGKGRCVITDVDGDKVFASWSCNGDQRGCKGPFNLVGGTGKFRGITGDNTFILRIAARELVAISSEDSFQQVAAGLAVWPKLQYRIP